MAEELQDTLLVSQIFSKTKQKYQKKHLLLRGDITLSVKSSAILPFHKNKKVARNHHYKASSSWAFMKFILHLQLLPNTTGKIVLSNYYPV